MDENRQNVSDLFNVILYTDAPYHLYNHTFGHSSFTGACIRDACNLEKYCLYSRTSMARTPMARLPWLIRTHFYVPTDFFTITQENIYEGNFLILLWNCMLCVLIRIASSRRFLWVHATYHYFVEDRKHFHKLSLFASWPGAMIKSHWLELPNTRTNFHGPKDVRATEVWL